MLYRALWKWIPEACERTRMFSKRKTRRNENTQQKRPARAHVTAVVVELQQVQQVCDCYVHLTSSPKQQMKDNFLNVPAALLKGFPMMAMFVVFSQLLIGTFLMSLPKLTSIHSVSRAPLSGLLPFTSGHWICRC